MAGISGIPTGDSSVQKTIALSQQKKIFDDVIDCIVQLKTDYFENNQSITDDSLNLQRFCAKFEHMIQMGMKEKTSLLGRRKDYWDYFNECLGAAKGTNDGIKYVKSLGESKTSLGRGRGFIRFCLVHQRLADTIQQCVVHEKTKDWFLPNAVFVTQASSSMLINSLYDLNSLHFDLAPRGYDLDSAWPSFANRKRTVSGTWTSPLSRKSSLTSMDTVSQISIPVANTAEVDRLTKDLENAQNTKGDLIGQIGSLQQEKEQISQSAWETQGELQAVQQQIIQQQKEFSALQKQHKDLGQCFFKLKMEKDHLEKLRHDEQSAMTERFKDVEAKRVAQLQAEEKIWKREVKDEAERKQRDIDKLKLELESNQKEAAKFQSVIETMVGNYKTLEEQLKIQLNSKSEDILASFDCLKSHVHDISGQLSQVSSEKGLLQEQIHNEEFDTTKEVCTLKGRLIEQEKSLTELKDSRASLQAELTSLTTDLATEKKKSEFLQEKLSSAETDIDSKNQELLKSNDLIVELKEKIENCENNLKSSKNEIDMLKDGSEMVLNELNAEIEAKNNELKDLWENLEGKEAVFTDSLSKLQTEKQDLLDDLVNRNVKLIEIEEALEKMEKQYNSIAQEAEEAGSGALVLTEKLAKAEHSFTEMQVKYRDLDEKCLALESAVNLSNKNLREKDAQLVQILEENKSLQRYLLELEDNLKANISDKERAFRQLENLVIEKNEFAASLNSVRTEYEVLKKDVDQEKIRVITLLKDADGVKKSDGEKSEQISKLLAQIEELNMDKKKQVSDLTEKLATIQSELASTVSSNESLERELNDIKSTLAQSESEHKEEISIYKAQIEESSNKLANVEEKLNLEVQNTKTLAIVKEKLNLEVENTTKLESDLKTKEENFKTEIERLHQELKKLEEENNEKKEFSVLMEEKSEFVTKLENEVSRLNKTLNEEAVNHTEQLQELKSELDEMTKERDHLLTQTNAAWEDAQQIKLHLTETSEQLASSYSQLETAVTEKQTLADEVKNMEEELSRIESEKDSLKKQVEDLRQALDLAEDEAQAKLKEKREIEEKFEQLIVEKSEAMKELEGYQSQTEFSTKVLEESLTEVQATLEAVKAEKVELDGKLSLSEQKEAELSNKVKELESEKSHLQTEVQNMKDSVNDSNNESLEALTKEREEHSSTVESLRAEISALQFQLSSEQMQRESTQGSSDSDKTSRESLLARVSDQEIIIEQLETEVASLQQTRQADIGNLVSQETELKLKHEKLQKEAEALKSSISRTEASLSEERVRSEDLQSEMKTLVSSQKATLSEKQAEIDRLLSDNAQIKRQLVKLIKDKDSLWQKTDKLVDEKKRKSSERWQDNSVVTHCPLCQTEFSLFVRKHHCRLCGKIYCWSCSDNWLDVPHSSKKARVCKTCYDQENATTDNVSMIDNDSDGDEDEVSDASDRSGSVPRVSVSPVSPSVMSSNVIPVLADNNETDEGKMRQRSAPSLMSNAIGAMASVVGLGKSWTSEHSHEETSGRPEGLEGEEDMFQVVSQEEVERSMTEYSSGTATSLSIPDNMASSMVLCAEELVSGDVNKQNEVWVKPGKKFAVPIHIRRANTVLHWQFTSQPKDIVFSVDYRANEAVPVSESESVVAPCKCDSHKQMVTGELEVKDTGIYSLIFDNTYSRMTSKKVHYYLEYNT